LHSFRAVDLKLLIFYLRTDRKKMFGLQVKNFHNYYKISVIVNSNFKSSAILILRNLANNSEMDFWGHSVAIRFRRLSLTPLRLLRWSAIF
jgi:hypothetical protein